MPSIALADPRQDHRLREWLQNVYPLYLHDISEFDASRYRLTTSGHWSPDYLPYWLEHSFCLPLVALASDDPIGFAFVGRPPFPFMSASCDFRLCEFFVLRAYRRTGLGRMIALEVFSKMPGIWELVVLSRNMKAAQFWREVLPLACTARPRESSDANGFHFLFSTGRVVMRGPLLKVLRADEGAHFNVFGSAVTYKATAEDTAGAFSLAIETTPPGAGLPLHIHHREDEAMYILEGEYEIQCGDRTLRADPGTFVFLPRDVPNRYENVGDKPGRFLHITSPGGFEQVVAETSRLLSAGHADMQKVNDVARDHGIDFV